MAEKNADLIGYEFVADDGNVWRVLGTAPWSGDGGYVSVECVDVPVSGRAPAPSVRVAAQVRLAKEALERSEWT